MVKSPMLAGVSPETVSELAMGESNVWWESPKYGVLDFIHPASQNHAVIGQKTSDAWSASPGRLDLEELDIAPDAFDSIVDNARREQGDITRTGEGLYDIVNSRDVTAIDRPYTIGLVVKADEGDRAGLAQREEAVRNAKILTRALVKTMMKDKGLDADNVKVNFVFCIDDGSTEVENMERLETFKSELEKNAGEGKRAFAFVLSTDKRESSGFFKDKAAWRGGKALHDVADLVALKGDYLPVSWQMLSGLLFANYIDSKKRADAGADERAEAIVDDIILAVSKMTGRDPSSLKELEDLKTIPADKLSDEKFNGISIVLDLPPMKTMTGTFEECLKADQAFKKSL
jgi:hypothetical protein